MTRAMTPGPLRLLCSGVVVVLAAVTLEAGGWAVITVKDLPDYVVVGRPVTLTYAVRQHGRNLLGGLDGRLEVRAGGHLVRTAATADSETGYYSATFTLPNPGNWTIDILTGFPGGINSSRVRVRAIAPEDRVPPMTEADRGRRLFTAKGCITCHVHPSVNGNGISSGGPALTREYQPEYLRQILLDPPKPQPRQPYPGWPMPDLGLRDAEIASLVAFINAGGKS